VEHYIECAPGWARWVVNCWGDASFGRKVTFSSDFLNLLDKACRYEAAMRFVEGDDSKFGVSHTKAVHEMEESRSAFAQEFKRLANN
jgi:hypothetical protein